MKSTKPALFEEIRKVISSISIESLSQERKTILRPLIEYIQTKVDSQEDIRLNLICTHNSRRSHLSQVWAQTAAAYFDIKNVHCYSGGTEATALYPMIAKTLERSGFKINPLSEGQNPIYAIKFGKNEPPIIGFSKTYDAPFNPESGFAAILTCSHADGACPYIAGAEKRIPITYEDPKAFDSTPLQSEKYLERSLEIASEMIYVFSQIKQ